MSRSHHLMINGLSIGSGGGYTVGRELFRHIAAARPNWSLSMPLISGYRLHEQMKQEDLPDNCRLFWAPANTTKRLARRKYENTDLVEWSGRHGVDVVLQLNGMVIPKLKKPTLCHNQDPWPYRSEAWGGWKDRLIAMAKRREHRRSLRQASCVGWTSHYLRDLICGYFRFAPSCSEVFHNGVPESWVKRASVLPDWRSRPMEILTVSNVAVYKRQHLVIEALPRIIQLTGEKDLVYRIIGQCAPSLREWLMNKAQKLGVADRVTIEGRVSDERVQELFARAKCYVLMSVCESFGIPAIEAMTYGTPVVTSDCCAMPEVCGDAATLCPVDDVGVLADGVAGVLTDADYAETLRQKGAARVGRFRWADTAERMAGFLDQIALKDIG